LIPQITLTVNNFLSDLNRHHYCGWMLTGEVATSWEAHYETLLPSCSSGELVFIQGFIQWWCDDRWKPRWAESFQVMFGNL